MELLCATILVLVVTSRNIILAADSKKTHLTPDGVTDAGVMKKIHETNGYYYAASGLYEDNKFSMRAILHYMLSKYPDFNEAVQHIAAPLTATLKDYFTRLKEKRPNVFTQLLQHSSSGGEIFIVKKAGLIPSAAIIDYKISERSGIELNTWTTNTAMINTDKTCFWRAVGHTFFANNRLPSEKEMAMQPIEGAKKIIQDGIKAHPCFAGAPIHLLEMNATSEHYYMY